MNDGYINMWEWSVLRNVEVGGFLTDNDTLVAQYRDDNGYAQANRVYLHYASQPDIHTHLSVDDSIIKEIINGSDTLRGMTIFDLGVKIDDTNYNQQNEKCIRF